MGSSGVNTEGDDEVDGEPEIEALADVNHVQHEEPGEKKPEDDVDGEGHGETELLVPGEEERDAREDEREDEKPERQHGSGEVDDDLGTKHGEQGQGVDQGVLLKASWRNEFALRSCGKARV